MKNIKHNTEIIIGRDKSGLKLKSVLQDEFKGVSYSTIQKLLRKKLVKLNGKKAEATELLTKGDIISFPNFIAENFLVSKDDENEDILPENISNSDIETIRKRVIFKNENLLVINKPHGLSVQGGTGIRKSIDDMLKFLKFELEENPRLVHRLDKDTSGLLLVARNRKTADLLTEYFRNKDNNITKVYLALVVGVPTKKEGLINIPLLKKFQGKEEKVYKDLKDGKTALTKYMVIAEGVNKDVSLLKLQLVTGRTHQIRVHLKEIGYPIVGDGKYGGKKAFVEGLSDKLHLHSYRTSIKDLFGKDLKFEALPPKYMQESLQKCGIRY